MKNSDRFKWIRYNYRPKTKKGDALFKQWIEGQTWSEIHEVLDADTRAEALVRTLNETMNKCYPLKRIKKRSADDPWITPGIRLRIGHRMRVYRREKRSALWKQIKNETNRMIKESKRGYYDKYVKAARESNDPSI